LSGSVFGELKAFFKVFIEIYSLTTFLVFREMGKTDLNS